MRECPRSESPSSSQKKNDMDAVELARQRASDLHFAAVARGHDPWAPYAFTVAEAMARGLAVEKAAKGAAVLDGGRAVLQSLDRLIVHEDAGSPFEQAFLVAHEIGHAELGDDHEAGSTVEIDPARSSESPPLGIDRVVDYGSRQRREVQMDLFAREFLLPRKVVRKLHLEQGQGCSEIASRLGAPFEVVAQQMLDALLLPLVVPEPDKNEEERPLNELQRRAAGHRGRAFLLQAGPGTGKTRTLVAHVDSLLEEGVDPRKILLLTFSNKAAGEMGQRIGRRRPDAAAAMWIGTFHKFGLDLLRRFNDEFGLPADPRLMDRTEAVELLEHEFPRLSLIHYRNLYDPSQNIADILSAISRAKDEVVDAARYAELADAMRVAAVTPEQAVAADRASEVSYVYRVYEEIKRQAGCVDFGDLVLLPVQLLERNAAVRAHLQGTYDHVLVDEYQDVNRSSVRLLTALKPNGWNLWVVGDTKQSIYRFRGASSFSMSRFGNEDFGGGHSASLECNYRSVPEVVDLFSEFAAGMRAGGVENRLKATREPTGHPPELRIVSDGGLVSAAVAESIEATRAMGWGYCDQAVLCRGNDKLSELGQELERLGIPVLFLGSLFERQEVKDLVSLLSLYTDRRAMGLLRVACWAEFEMKMEDVGAIFEHLRATESPAGTWLHQEQTIAGQSPAGKAALDQLRLALAGFDRASNPWTVLATVMLDRTRMAAAIGSSDSVPDQARGIAIWQFMNFVRVQPRGVGLPIVRLMDRIRRLLRLRDERDLRQLPAAAQSINAVRLMTIHGSKGLEFPVVHIVGLNQDTMPGAFTPAKCPPPDGMVEGGQGTSADVVRAAHFEEQECLFYVGMSRARDGLFLYATTSKVGGTRRPLSDFVDRLGSALTRSETFPTRRLPPAPEMLDLQVAFEGQVSFNAAQVALYESCPRRFLYTHLLQVGGRRTASGFILMHEAVRSVFEAVIASSGVSTGNLEALVAQAFSQHGLHDHGYVDDYRRIALTMLRYFVSSREAAVLEAPMALSLTFDEVQIVVWPDEVLVRGGVRTLRRVDTGHAPRSDPKDVGAAAFVMAAKAALPGALVELVYLADEAAKPLWLTDRELANRQGKLGDMLGGIRRGSFPANRSAYVCPGCPAFFICGPTPTGTLCKVF